MKKIVAFLLLTVFFLNIIGYHFLFQIQQYSIKMQVKKEIRQAWKIQNATELRFSLSDRSALAKLQWEDEKEFIFNGEMYDVIEKKTDGNELIILCVKDKKESHLVSNYERLNKETQSDPLSKNKSTILLKLITGVFIQNNVPVISIPDFSNEKNQINLTENISPAIKEILIPPQV